jgi:hypothetical protein
MRRTLIATILAAGLGTACGSAHVCPDVALPDPWAARRVELAGTWEVVTADGVLDGTMTFSGTTVEAISGETRLVGTWSAHDAASGADVELIFSESHRPGIDEVWGEPTAVELHLVVIDADTVYALQTNGIYTRWTRAAFGEP